MGEPQNRAMSLSGSLPDTTCQLIISSYIGCDTGVRIIKARYIKESMSGDQLVLLLFSPFLLVPRIS
ncbi:hypothetical protein VRK_02060 [Vibrio sp. MEBiC08052]|nr:hypothetical protein VRK_02060 [Vibrio sp. MEBiC08052]